ETLRALRAADRSDFPTPAARSPPRGDTGARTTRDDFEPGPGKSHGWRAPRRRSSATRSPRWSLRPGRATPPPRLALLVHAPIPGRMSAAIPATAGRAEIWAHRQRKIPALLELAAILIEVGRGACL